MNRIEDLQFQIRNTHEALRMIAGLHPHQFVPDLNDWTAPPKLSNHIKSLLATGHKCGTLACFGGHLPRDEYFSSIGVRGNSDGAPYMFGDNGQYLLSYSLGDHLFGDGYVFLPQGTWNHNEDEMDERDAVHQRLTNVLARLEVQLRTAQRKAEQEKQRLAKMQEGVKARQQAERIARQASAFVEQIKAASAPGRDMGHVK